MCEVPARGDYERRIIGWKGIRLLLATEGFDSHTKCRVSSLAVGKGTLSPLT